MLTAKDAVGPITNELRQAVEAAQFGQDGEETDEQAAMLVAEFCRLTPSGVSLITGHHEQLAREFLRSSFRDIAFSYDGLTDVERNIVTREEWEGFVQWIKN